MEGHRMAGRLADFVEDVKQAHLRGNVVRSARCVACNGIIDAEFPKLNKVQTKYVNCECGNLVAVRCFP